MPTPLLPPIRLLGRLYETVQQLQAQFDRIGDQRASNLRLIAGFFAGELRRGRKLDLMFACVHNSRRSQLSQVWSNVACTHYRIGGIRAFSGGSAATAVHPAITAALGRQGFDVRRPPGAPDGNEPCEVRYADGAGAIKLWSKLIDDLANPQHDLVAVWNCPQSDDSCPHVPGATRRFAILFTDPRVSDGTPTEAATYGERADQIGRELLYLFSCCAEQLRPGSRW